MSIYIYSLKKCMCPHATCVYIANTRSKLSCIKHPKRQRGYVFLCACDEQMISRANVHQEEILLFNLLSY